MNLDAIDFSIHLHDRNSGTQKIRRGDRTKTRLFWAGSKVLLELGYRDLNVEDVCAKASVAKGTFYIYFKSKEAFLTELATQYIAFELKTAPSFRSDLRPFSAVFQWIEWYEQIFAANVGILRCLVQMSATSPEALALWHHRNDLIVNQILVIFNDLFDLSAVEPSLFRVTVRAAGGIIDQSLFERLRVQPGPGREETATNLLLEVHALLFYRGITGRSPEPDEIESVRALIDPAKPKRI